ncbi:hypothetical protein SAMN05444162_2551 [Paenibacillaceae bacterium GAS479]|nr:hypothetical protein SAMN05444162_2551 [Paenibacillaceae bacterium GAS479]
MAGQWITPKEYSAKVILTKDQISQAMVAQSAILENGLKIFDGEKLVNLLNGAAVIIGAIFLKNSAVGLGGVIHSVFSAILPGSRKQKLENMLKDGIISGYMKGLDFMSANGDRYDMVEIELPFYEFVNTDATQNWRFASGGGRVTRAKVKGGGWQE